MFVNLDEVKVLRDPVLGYIHIDKKVVWDCIDSKEFQRLRRIKQLGGSFIVYHTAEHSRFPHSLGVYEITRRMIEEVRGLKESINEYEEISLLLAALLHDIGHLPFSHAFESISNTNHEEYTKKIILEDSEVHRILVEADKDLPDNIVMILNHEHPNKLLSQIVSSQLDSDRMDYLLRDAYFTGTTYGEYDIGRLFRTFRIHNNKLVIKESGINSVEDYIMARYHMYWQVYFHPVSRSYEIILRMLFKRLTYLYKNEPRLLLGCNSFYPIFEDRELNIVEHYLLDETACISMFKAMSSSDDKIASDLSNRLLNRDLFEYEEFDNKSYEEIRKQLVKDGFDPEYYLIVDDTMKKPYEPFSNNEIWILMKKTDTLVEIKDASVIVNSIVQGDYKKVCKIYYPK
jgi:HD superfamily phosphohydrolase